MNIRTHNPLKSQVFRSQPAAATTLSSDDNSKGVVDSYVSDVRENFKQNGAFGAIINTGLNGMLGGFAGRLAGNLVSGFFPGPVGAAIGTYAGAAGATLGAAQGLAGRGFF